MAAAEKLPILIFLMNLSHAGSMGQFKNHMAANLQVICPHAVDYYNEYIPHTGGRRATYSQARRGSFEKGLISCFLHLIKNI